MAPEATLKPTLKVLSGHETETWRTQASASVRDHRGLSAVLSLTPDEAQALKRLESRGGLP
jgi:hypothetical protein